VAAHFDIRRCLWASRSSFIFHFISLASESFIY